MKIETVKSADSKHEYLYALLTAILIIAVCGILIYERRRPDNLIVIQETQISVFNDLNSFEQGIYNDLLSAANEIEFFHEDNGETEWPTIKLLSEEYIAPFVKDSAWEARGKIEWTQKIVEIGSNSSDTICAILGQPQNTDVSGSFLILFFSDHEDEEATQIWYKNGDASDFPNSFKETNLGLSGWLEAVPYTGEEELHRLKG